MSKRSYRKSRMHKLETALAREMPIWLVVLFFCLMCAVVAVGIYVALHAHVIGPED